MDLCISNFVVCGQTLLVRYVIALGSHKVSPIPLLPKGGIGQEMLFTKELMRRKKRPPNVVNIYQHMAYGIYQSIAY